MKINRVQITNYRNLKDIDVKMENITTLVGENNSGKSNFLHAVILPLSSEDGFGSTKRLTWYDINNDAKDSFYAYLKNKRTDILSGLISVEDFSKQLPYHSRFVTNDIDTFKDRIETITINLSESSKNDINTFLMANSKQFITLESRLADLLIAEYKIRFDTGKIGYYDFPSVIAHSRNYYIHYDERIKNN